jgi:competence ComEA-like helix-hairpin-helix protein
VLEKLSRKFGFTVTEIKVLFFLICVFIAGLSYKAYKLDLETSEYKDYDYSAEERLFEQLSDNNKEQTGDSTEDKYIDSKQEVLDFNSSNFDKKEALKLPGIKSININTAGIKDLVILPGIGEKTAQKIIELRNKKGRFNKLEELLEVRGIGKTRFSNIEKFLYIEQSNFFKAPEEK